MIEGLPAAGFELRRGWSSYAVADISRGIVWEQPTLRIFGRSIPAPRLTAWFGERAYTYSGKRNAPAPMPAWVDGLRARLELEIGVRFNSALLNLYRDGRDSVAWHADDERELGLEPTIASLSYGAARRFLIKGLGRSWGVTLENGDLLLMRGRAQRDFQHSVPKTSQPVGPRLNLTFRRIS